LGTQTGALFCNQSANIGFVLIKIKTAAALGGDTPQLSKQTFVENRILTTRSGDDLSHCPALIASYAANK
jgi:hypothetical protein